jgi:hypothetical protein
VTQRAADDERNTVTPEDVADAVEAGADPSVVATEVLRILGKTTGWGAEDPGLVAFMAAEGEERAARAAAEGKEG